MFIIGKFLKVADEKSRKISMYVILSPFKGIKYYKSLIIL